MDLPEQVLEKLKAVFPEAYNRDQDDLREDDTAEAAKSATPTAPKKPKQLVKKAKQVLAEVDPKFDVTDETSALKKVLRGSLRSQHRAAIERMCQELTPRAGKTRHLGLTFYNAFILHEVQRGSRPRRLGGLALRASHPQGPAIK